MKTYYYKMVAVSAIIATLSSCERATEAVCPTEIKTAATNLTVETARQIYEAERGNLTRSAEENLTPFAVGDPLLHWEQAETSSSDLISSVDIPITGQRRYKVIRYNENGEEYVVNAHTKIIVVQSNETQKIQSFIRVCIPDAGYDSPDSENISNRTLNCDDRGEYTGLEYYATLDGFPAAISRYEAGEMVCGLYFFDETLTREEKVRIFAQLLGNTWIKPIDETRGFIHEDFDNPQHGGIFIEESTGNIYVFVDANGDGIVDSVTDLYHFLELYGTNGGGSPGGDNGGSPGGNPSSGTTPGGGSNNGGNNNEGSNDGNTGGGMGGSSGGNTGGESGNNSGEGEDNSNPGIEINNPLPFDPENPYYEGGELVGPPAINPGDYPTPPGANNPIIIPPKGDEDSPKDDEDEEEDEETRLGHEAIQKMISDLESGNVQIYECTITDNFEALLYAVGIGSNTTGIITSCINFLESAAPFEKALGNSLTGVGAVISAMQTVVAFSDGEYSTADWMNAVSTALSAISVTCIFLPAPFAIVGGVAGVTSCLIGLASNFVSYNGPMLIHLEMPDGEDAYLYLA